jgi:hypothetical protein
MSMSRTKNKKPEQLASWIDAAKLFAAEDIEMCEEVRCTESLCKGISLWVCWSNKKVF